MEKEGEQHPDAIARPSVDHQLEDARAERARITGELVALGEGAERELLGARVETTVKAMVLVERQRARGLPVDVLTTSSRVGSELFAAVYERLGITGARADSEPRPIYGDEGVQLGVRHKVLDGPELSVEELEHDDASTGDRYRTLRVTRREIP